MIKKPLRLWPILAILMAITAAPSAYGVQVVEVVDFPDADAVQVRGINNAGDIVGYRTVDGVTTSFVRTTSGFTFFQVDSADTFALDMNDFGDVVGGVNTTLPGQDAFLRSVGGSTFSFQPNGNSDAAANGINNAGVIVGSGNAFGTGGFLRATDGAITSINFPADFGSTILKTNATDINNSGLIVGHAIGQRGPDFFASGWFSNDGGTTYSAVDIPGEQFTYAWSANDTGLLVGDFSTGFSGDRTGFVYHVGTRAFSPFAVPGADWTVPTSINDAGQIAGFWRDALTGRVSGFVAVVPEPTAWTTVTIALFVGYALNCRKRK